MIKLRDLEYLDAIEQHRHFGKAASACYVSQPTLSGQLMKLEEQLGLQLVERHRHNVMLTPAGEKLVIDARKVLNAAQDFERQAKDLLDPLAGDIHMGLIPTLAPYIYSPTSCLRYRESCQRCNSYYTKIKPRFCCKNSMRASSMC